MCLNGNGVGLGLGLGLAGAGAGAEGSNTRKWRRMGSRQEEDVQPTQLPKAAKPYTLKPSNPRAPPGSFPRRSSLKGVLCDQLLSGSMRDATKIAKSLSLHHILHPKKLENPRAQLQTLHSSKLLALNSASPKPLNPTKPEKHPESSLPGTRPQPQSKPDQGKEEKGRLDLGV